MYFKSRQDPEILKHTTFRYEITDLRKCISDSFRQTLESRVTSSKLKKNAEKNLKVTTFKMKVKVRANRDLQVM